MKILSNLAFAAFVGLNAAALIATLWVGRGYYVLEKAARPDDPLHVWLAPGAPWGVLLGIWGTSLMVLMLLYTLRKWLMGWNRLGSLGSWLRFHIACGVTGPLFITVHGGLYVPEGLISVGFACMLLVAASGVFGRYVHGLLPRLKGGQELAWDGAMLTLAELRAELVAETRDSRGDEIGDALALVEGFEFEARTLWDLLGLLVESRSRRAQINGLLASTALPIGVQRQAKSTLFSQLRLRRGIEASAVAHRLFRYWHLFHRPLAGAMYVIITVHIGVAVLLGGSLSGLLELVP